MMRHFYIISLLLTISFKNYAQSPIETTLIKKIDGQFSAVFLDALGNLFAITANGQLKKYNPSLDSLGVFNELKRYGNIHSISAQNPLRTILYFKGYKNIIVLDRLMQIINKIDLRKKQLFQVQAVAQSYDNRIWIFDEQDYKIKKLDLDGSILFETSDLRLVLGETMQPSSIFEANGLLYLYDIDKGLYSFDYYGAFKTKVALLGWHDIQEMGNSILGIKEGKLMVYLLNPPSVKEFLLPELFKRYEQFHFSSTIGVGLTATGIEAFKLNYK